MNGKTHPQCVPLPPNFARLLWSWITVETLKSKRSQWSLDAQDLHGALLRNETRFLFCARTGSIVEKNSETCSVLSASLPPRLFTTFFLQSSKWCWLQIFTNRAWGRKGLQQDLSTSARLRANGLFLQSIVFFATLCFAQNMPIDRPFRLPGPLCGPLLVLNFGGFAMAQMK